MVQLWLACSSLSRTTSCFASCSTLRAPCADPSPALSSTRWACLELPISLGQLACNLIPLGGQSLQPAASCSRPLCADNEEYSGVRGARSRETSSAYCGRTMLLIRTRRRGRHRRHAPGHAEFKRRCSRNGRCAAVHWAPPSVCLRVAEARPTLPSTSAPEPNREAWSPRAPGHALFWCQQTW